MTPDTQPENFSVSIENAQKKEVETLTEEIFSLRELIVQKHFFKGLNIPFPMEELTAHLESIDNIHLFTTQLSVNSEQYYLDIAWNGEWIANEGLLRDQNFDQVLNYIVLTFDKGLADSYIRLQGLKNASNDISISTDLELEMGEKDQVVIEQLENSFTKILESALHRNRLVLLKRLAYILRTVFANIDTENGNQPVKIV